MSFAATWIELETLILSEVSQKEKDKYHGISLISAIQYMAQMKLFTEKEVTDLEKRLVVAKRGWAGGWVEGVIRPGSLELIDATYCI